MKQISLDSKILNLTHKDLDGCGCSIVLGNTFPRNNIKFWYTNYNQINSVLENLNYDNYDFIILTDISPSNRPDLINQDKLILLDHHDSAKIYEDKIGKNIVNNKTCGTLLVKKWCEATFGVNLSYLNTFATIVNDYDLWIHDDPRSKKLNELFYFYWQDNFRKRFFDGDVTFNEIEVKYLKKREARFQEVWKDLVVYESDMLNGCFIQEREFVNDLCEKLLTENKYDFVFCRNPKSKNISIRSSLDSNPGLKIHLGEMLTDLNIGGGHHHSAGINSVQSEQIQDIISLVENKINDILENKKEIVDG